MIPFNQPICTGKELTFLQEAIANQKICGDGVFTAKCSNWIKEKTGTEKALLTTSCTHALEMAAILIDAQPGDEIIMASYTFSSTANAFVLRGASIVFIDITPDTMNMNAALIESAITKKTKAIVVMHYAGVSCDMDSILDIADKHNLYVIEDAAQGIMSAYKDQPLGAIGDIGCFSFHETKNYTMGEGGALLINNARFVDRAEIIREKGTNRSQFHRGQVDKYSWMDQGSSYLPSELNAAYLWAQLEIAGQINDDRLKTWHLYHNKLSGLASRGLIELPVIPESCVHNAHMYYIKLNDIEARQEMIEFLKSRGIMSVFHYIPLHSAPAGKQYGRFHGSDIYTTRESERLLRLPMYYQLPPSDTEYICDCIKEFFDENN